MGWLLVIEFFFDFENKNSFDKIAVEIIFNSNLKYFYIHFYNQEKWYMNLIFSLKKIYTIYIFYNILHVIIIIIDIAVSPP